ncbi:MAG: hypothetical protein NTW72_15665 [Gemmatimonadetes bacterium]|nr:hypothetical protein [Gemmatimonadota bacterium]
MMRALMDVPGSRSMNSESPVTTMPCIRSMRTPLRRLIHAPAVSAPSKCAKPKRRSASNPPLGVAPSIR